MKLPKLEFISQKKTCNVSSVGDVWQSALRGLSLRVSPARRFGSCQWQSTPRPPLAYLIYRWILFLFVVSVGISSFACQELPTKYKGPVALNRWKWFIYFTNWGFMLVALQAGLALAVVHKYRAERALSIPCEERDQYDARSETPLLCRTYWIAHTIATDLAFVITIVYWSLVHDPEIHDINANNLLVHGGNSIIMVCELLVTAHPVRAAHALYGVCAGLAYGVFSAAYWAAGGTGRLGQTAIYPALDWDKPGKAVGFVAMCAVVLCGAHALATALAAARGRVAARRSPPVRLDNFAPLATH